MFILILADYWAKYHAGVRSGRFLPKVVNLPIFAKSCIMMRRGDFREFLWGKDVKIAIVDDEAVAREALQKVLRTCGIELVAQAEMQLFASGEEFFASFAPDKFQLVFLDICIQGINGIETALAVRKQAEQLPIIFLTNSADYALEGYQAYPAGYLLKPIEHALPQLMDILQRLLPVLAERSLLVQMNGRTIKVPWTRIAYIDVQGGRRVGGRRGCVIHLLAGDGLAVDNPYAEVAARLDEADFVECYNHVIVNLAAVSALNDDSFALSNGERLPISRRLYRETAHEYMEYLLRK